MIGQGVIVKMATEWRKLRRSPDMLMPLLFLLLAFVLRLYRLDGQSLWYDEGTSVALAQRSVSTIIQSAGADIHPPLYYLVLKLWVQFFGTSEIAVRLLSVFTGVAVVAVIYVMAGRLFGRSTVQAATFLAALSPFLVYYSQETRMYMLATLLSSLSVYTLIVALAPWIPPFSIVPTPPEAAKQRLRRNLPWFAYVVVTSAALYTHYFAATVVLAQDVAIAAMLLWGSITRRSDWRFQRGMVIRLVAAQSAVALVYLPWLPVMAGQFHNWPAISEFYNLPVLVARLFPIFSLGLTAHAVNRVLVAIFAAVLTLGILPWPTTEKLPESPLLSATEQAEDEDAASAHAKSGNIGAFAYVLTVSWLVIPVLTMFILSLRRPLYNPKFLLVAVPAFCLLLARGCHVLASLPPTPVLRQGGRILGTIALVILAVGSLMSLRAYYDDPHYARDDYRAVVRSIVASSHAGDAILLNAPGQIDIFGYYYKGDLTIYPLPRSRPLDEQATIDELKAILSSHDRMWVVYYGDQQADPQRVIESWLDRHAFKASDRWFGNVRLALYARFATAGETMQPLDVRFGESIQLNGYRLATGELPAGDIVPLTLFWQTRAQLNDRFSVFVHIIDRHNVLWGQRDGEPGSGLRPTTTWLPGETIQDNYGVPILPGTPPGDYQIEIGLYRPETGQRLPITDSSGKALGDRILVGPLVVGRPATPPSAEALGMQHQLTATVSSLRLLGYSLVRLGQEPGEPEFAGTDILHLTLFWQATTQPVGDLIMSVRVMDGRGQIVVERTTRPVNGDYPTTRWEMHEMVRDQYHLPLGGLNPGRYRLAVEVRDASGRRVGEIRLGELTVR